MAAITSLPADYTLVPYPSLEANSTWNITGRGLGEGSGYQRWRPCRGNVRRAAPAGHGSVFRALSFLEDAEKISEMPMGLGEEDRAGCWWTHTLDLAFTCSSMPGSISNASGLEQTLRPSVPLPKHGWNSDKP